MKDRRLKILCVCDGGITRTVMEPMRELEQ